MPLLFQKSTWQSEYIDQEKYMKNFKCFYWWDILRYEKDLKADIGTKWLTNNIFLLFVMTALACGKCNIFYVSQEVVYHFLLIYSLLFLIRSCVHSSGTVIHIRSSDRTSTSISKHACWMWKLTFCTARYLQRTLIFRLCICRYSFNLTVLEWF